MGISGRKRGICSNCKKDGRIYCKKKCLVCYQKEYRENKIEKCAI